MAVTSQRELFVSNHLDVLLISCGLKSKNIYNL